MKSVTSLCTVLSLITATCSCVAQFTSRTDPPPLAPGDQDSGTAGDEGPDNSTAQAAETYAMTAVMRRLTAREYNNAVRQLLGIAPPDSNLVLPADLPGPTEDYPFDNNAAAQAPSSVLVEGSEALAVDIARTVMADDAARARLVRCTPSGPGDITCARSFIEPLLRRAYRRPPFDEEIDGMLALFVCPADNTELSSCGFAIAAGDFWFAAEAALSAVLMDPSFLYRVETGAPTGEEGIYALDDYEVATRLSFFLWGHPPDDELLAIAAAGGLGTANEIVAVALSMLPDYRTRDQVQEFHAQWFGYNELDPMEPFRGPMIRETETLLDRVIFQERRPWAEIFTATETYIGPPLAQHYGLEQPESLGWVSYGNSGRGGILSHGSFLATAGAAGEDTSPMLRGKLVTTVLMCTPIPPPPPDKVDPPLAEEAPCKRGELRIHSSGKCASCHQYMDGIGFGLEAYDTRGKLRATEFERPNCAIDGEGEFIGTSLGSSSTDFNGPKELGELLVASGAVQRCAAHQLFRFAFGRNVFISPKVAVIHADDFVMIDYLAGRFGESGRFDDLILDIVGSFSFRHRIADM